MAEVFTQVVQKPPAVVESLAIVIKYRAEYDYETDPPTLLSEARTAAYQGVLCDADGLRVPERLDRGNLVPYLSAGERTSAEAFLNAQLAKFEGLIP